MADVLKELKNTGFISAADYQLRGPNIFIAVYGGPKTGKTHFAREVVGPTAYQGVDYGHQGVIDDAVSRGHVIPATDYEYPALERDAYRTEDDYYKALRAAADSQWRDMQRDFHAAIRAKSVRTIIWDTGTEFYETMVLARYGRLTEIPGLGRGKLKREFGTEMRLALNSGKNFIYLAKESDVWKQNKPTGETKPSGFPELGHYAEVVIRLYKKRRAKGYQYLGEIMDCRLNRDLEGEVVEGLDYPTLMEMVRPDVDVEELYCAC